MQTQCVHVTYMTFKKHVGTKSSLAFGYRFSMIQYSCPYLKLIMPEIQNKIKMDNTTPLF